MRPPVPQRHPAPDRRGVGQPGPVAGGLGAGDRLADDLLRLEQVAAAQQVVAERGEQVRPAGEVLRRGAGQQAQRPPGVAGRLVVGQPAPGGRGGTHRPVQRPAPGRAPGWPRRSGARAARQRRRARRGCPRPAAPAPPRPGRAAGPGRSRDMSPSSTSATSAWVNRQLHGACPVDDQAQGQGGVHRRHDLLGRRAGGLEQVQPGLPAEHGGEPEHVEGRGGQPGQPDAQHVAHRRRHRGRSRCRSCADLRRDSSTTKNGLPPVRSCTASASPRSPASQLGGQQRRHVVGSRPPSASRLALASRLIRVRHRLTAPGRSSPTVRTVTTILKQGTVSVPDPQGDELPAVCDAGASALRHRASVPGVHFLSRAPLAALVPAEGLQTLDPARVDPGVVSSRSALRGRKGIPFRDLIRDVKRRQEFTSEPFAFVPVLHIDDLGAVAWHEALRHRPSTPGLAAQPGDLIFSLLNPRRLERRLFLVTQERSSAQANSASSKQSAAIHTKRSYCFIIRSSAPSWHLSVEARRAPGGG